MIVSISNISNDFKRIWTVLNELRLTKINKDKERHKDTKIERLIDEKTKRSKTEKEERPKGGGSVGQGGGGRSSLSFDLLF